MSVVVEFENSSWVVDRGVRHTEWFVRLGAVWVRAAEAPDSVAAVAAEDPEDGSGSEERSFRPAGCQYLCRIRLALPIGTAVRRRVSTPRSPGRSASRGAAVVAFDLRRDLPNFLRHVKQPLSVVESEFRVTRRGLVRLEVWERARAKRSA